MQEKVEATTSNTTVQALRDRLAKAEFLLELAARVSENDILIEEIRGFLNENTN